MAGHHSVKVALSDEGLGRLHEATERFGMTQMQLVGRLLDFYISCSISYTKNVNIIA